MKKIMLGFIALTMAVGAIAFTNIVNNKKPAKTGTYWFLTDGAGNPQPSTSLNTSNPTSCTVSGVGCVAEFDSYAISSGHYIAAGNLLGDFKSR